MKLHLFLAALLAVGAAACEREGPAEQTGERIDETVEQAGEQVESAGESVEQQTDR